MTERIAEQIGDLEPIVRFVYSPFHVKKGKLKREAFQPPKQRKDVSVQRLQYSNETSCRNIGIGQQRLEEPSKLWMGMAAFKALVILAKSRNGEPIQLVASPMDNNGNYLPIERGVFSDDAGLPAHADILYEYETVEGEPLPTIVKQYAQYICEQSHFFADPNPTSTQWEGNLIKFNKE
jgi:hypothetical protein